MHTYVVMCGYFQVVNHFDSSLAYIQPLMHFYKPMIDFLDTKYIGMFVPQNLSLEIDAGSTLNFFRCP